MKRGRLERRTPLARGDKPLRRSTRPLARRAVSEASAAQRAKCREQACVVCRRPAPSDPAHLIDRALLAAGQDDPLAVIPLCREHHDAFDHGRLDLLPYLEPHRRDELAYAVQRYGLLATLRRVTNDRWVSVRPDKETS